MVIKESAPQTDSINNHMVESTILTATHGGVTLDDEEDGVGINYGGPSYNATTF